MAAGQGAACTVLANMVQGLAMAGAKEPEFQKPVQAVGKAWQEDKEIQTAIGKNGEITNGLADLYVAVSTNMDVNEVNKKIELAAGIPMAVVYARAGDILEKTLAKNTTKKAPPEVLKALMETPKGLDLTGIVYPAKLVRTYAYIAFAYLALSIWGMGFASLVWTLLYALPEEWNLGGVLFSGIRGGLTIVLSCILISIYLGAGLNKADSEAEKLIKENPSGLDVWYAAGASALSGAKNWAWDLFTVPWKIGKAFWNGAKTVAGGGGVGSAMGQFLGWATGMTLEQFMIGMLILTAPAQAAMMVKGANGIGEKAGNALNAQGASSQSVAGFLGQQTGGSGATAASGHSAADIMAGGVRPSFKPNSVQDS